MTIEPKISQKLVLDDTDKNGIDRTYESTVAVNDIIEDHTVAFNTSPPTEPLEAQEEIETLNPGELINNRYKVISVIGSGGMGVVYKVEDTAQGNKIIALKTFKTQDVSDESLRMFEAEFMLMTKLDHPNVANQYDFEKLQGSDDYFFTLEFVEGLDIFAATENASEETILEYLIQICRALSYLHSRKVIHFDLKPANILIDKDNNVKVLDFGVSRTTNSMQSGTVLGTPHYMAPEIVVDKTMVDHRYDIYSLGIILFQLITREKPFYGTSQLAILSAHCYTPLSFDPEIWSQFKAWLPELIVKMADKTPSQRHRNANEIIEHIQELSGTKYDIETLDTIDSYVTGSDFVGRENELEQLFHAIKAQVDARQQAQTPFFFIGGISGLGKSRLVREIKYKVQLMKHAFIEGNCYENSNSELAPIRELFEYLIRLAKASGQNELISRHEKAIALLAPHLLSPDENQKYQKVEMNEIKLALYEQLAEFIITLSERVPLVLYLNDLQWARSQTIEFLMYLNTSYQDAVKHDRTLKLLVLCTYRHNEIKAQPMERFLQQIEHHIQKQHIILENLNKKSITTIINSMLGNNELLDSFHDQVVKKSEGNPFFIEEIMRYLVESKQIFLTQGIWKTDSSTQVKIPPLEQIYVIRTDNLDDDEKNILIYLATIGKPTKLDLLEQLSKLSATDLLEKLNNLQKRHFIIKIFGDVITYRVTHDRIRSSVYNNCEIEFRKSIHHQIAQNLEKQIVADETILFDVALHYTNTDDQENSLKYSLLAGKLAKEKYENQSAITFFEFALKVLEKNGGGNDIIRQTKEDLADIYLLVGLFDKAELIFNELLTDAVVNLDKARFNNKLGNVYTTIGDYKKSRNTLLESLRFLKEIYPTNKLELLLKIILNFLIHFKHQVFPSLTLKATGDKEKRLVEIGSTYITLGSLSWGSVSKNEMLFLGLRALNVLEHCNKNVYLSFAYTGLGTVYSFLSLFAIAYGFLEKALKIAQDLKSQLYIGISYMTIGLYYYRLGNTKQAISDSQRAIDMLSRYGDMNYLSAAYLTVCNSNYYRGDLSAIIYTATHAYEIFQRCGSRIWGTVLLAYQGYAYGMMGDYEKGEKLLRNSIDEALKDNDPYKIGYTKTLLGAIEIRYGNMQTAVEILEQAKDIIEKNKLFNDIPMNIYPIIARAYLQSLVMLREEDRAKRENIKKKAIAASEKINKLARKKYPNHRPQALLIKAEIALHEKNFKIAKKLLDKCIKNSRKLSQQYHGARAEFIYAKLIIAESLDDNSKALSFLNNAYQVFSNLKYQRDEQELLDFAQEHSIQIEKTVYG